MDVTMDIGLTDLRSDGDYLLSLLMYAKAMDLLTFSMNNCLIPDATDMTNVIGLTDLRSDGDYLLPLLMYAKAMDLLTFSMNDCLKYGSPIKIVIAILPAIAEEDCKLPESSGSAGISAAGVPY